VEDWVSQAGKPRGHLLRRLLLRGNGRGFRTLQRLAGGQVLLLLGREARLAVGNNQNLV